MTIKTSFKGANEIERVAKDYFNTFYCLKIVVKAWKDVSLKTSARRKL